MRIIVIDNYDSFVYNLVHILRNIEGIQVDVFKNDKITIQQVEAYDKILLSPGPGIPEEAGNMQEILSHFAGKKSILGVCLGHQAIAENFGGSLINIEAPLHGVDSNMQIERPDYFFEGIPKDIKIGHYHSWVVNPDTLPPELEIQAMDKHGHIMALRHTSYDIHGVQFHPESVLTESGIEMIKNWVNA